jgi:hypothetical protein
MDAEDPILSEEALKKLKEATGASCALCELDDLGEEE